MNEAVLHTARRAVEWHAKVAERARAKAEVHEHQHEIDLATLERERQSGHLGYADAIRTLLKAVTKKPSVKTKPAAQEESPGFAAFWEAYPHKSAKGDARTAWGQKQCEGITETILAGVARCKRLPAWTKDNGEFIPLPATWLRREGWLDEGVKRDARPAEVAEDADPAGWTEFCKAHKYPIKPYRFAPEWQRSEFGRKVA